jgi:threonyl-tRNA synthetase
MPTQAILSISEKYENTKKFFRMLENHEISSRPLIIEMRRLARKSREAEIQKIPYMITVGGEMRKVKIEVNMAEKI